MTGRFFVRATKSPKGRYRSPRVGSLLEREMCAKRQAAPGRKGGAF